MQTNCPTHKQDRGDRDGLHAKSLSRMTSESKQQRIRTCLTPAPEEEDPVPFRKLDTVPLSSSPKLLHERIFQKTLLSPINRTTKPLFPRQSTSNQTN
ncbi:hypothetical protein CKAN_01592200 [Cinnamomum micranthum f. kanehirae]|uniref:Uncharacterized protein n=1 Tax=Cinnamomum micranthum f. kanehirae TaxID=337451 RepID=A0A443P886_9MAGN|nr:hypothetical protein CKAN_01592200 [Cinnamomum micranthum f. kanehirae]